MTHACVSDRPFALPNRELICVVVDLPYPPSVNRIWSYSRKGVRPSPEYEKWKKMADGCAMEQRVFRGLRPILGRFTIDMLIGDECRNDLDNNIKAVLDWCQSRAMISNDKNCQKITIEKVSKLRCPSGARIILTELAP